MSTSQRQSAPAPVQAQGSCPTRRRQQQKNVEVPFQPPEGYKWAPILIPEDQSEPPYSLEEVVPSNYTIWEPQSYLRHEGLSHDTKSMLYPLVDRVREAIRDSDIAGHVRIQRCEFAQNTGSGDLSPLIFRIDMRGENRCKTYGPQVEAIVKQTLVDRLSPKDIWELTEDLCVRQYAIPLRCAWIEDCIDDVILG